MVVGWLVIPTGPECLLYVYQLFTQSGKGSVESFLRRGPRKERFLANSGAAHPKGN